MTIERGPEKYDAMLQLLTGEFTGFATFLSTKESRCSYPLCYLHPLRTSFWAIFRGFPAVLVMCAAGRWRLCNANLPPQLRKVPCVPLQNENNKELSVAAASGVQCTHQNMSKSHSLLLPPAQLPMHDSPSLSCFLSLTLFSTYERHVWKR